MKIFIFLLISIITLFGECFPIEKNKNNISIIKSSKLNCINTNDKTICIQRDIIKSNEINSKEFQSICINAELIATGYPKLKDRTSKIEKWKYENSLLVSSDYVIIKLDDSIYIYDLNLEEFKMIKLPKNIIKTIKLFDKNFAFEYLDKKDNKIKLLLIDLKNYKITKIMNNYNTVIRKQVEHIIIDVIRDDKSAFKNKYPKMYNIDSIKLNNLFSKKFNSKNMDYKTTHKIEESKSEINDILDTHFTTKNIKNQIIVKSFIFNKNFELMSKKSMSIENDKIFEYLDKFNHDYSKLSGFVHGINSIFIIVVSLLILFLSYFSLHKIIGGFLLPTISSFFMLFYLVYVVIGAVSLNVFYFEYEYNLYLYERKDLLFNIWKYSISGLILIPIGMYMSNCIFKYNSKIRYNSFLNKNISYKYENKLLIITIISMCISIIILYIYMNKISYIPIFEVFQNLSSDELAKLRSDAGNGFEGKVYRYMLIVKTIPAVFLLISFFNKAVNKQWMYLFIFILIYNIFVNIIDLNKGPVINILLTLLIAHFFLIGKINWKQLSSFILVSFLLITIMYVMFMGLSTDGLLSTLLAPFHRVFIGSISPFYWWQLYIEQYGLLEGLSLPNPRHFFDFEYIQISKVVMNFVHPELNSLGIVGSMPMVFWGDWFMNFGIIYIFISMLLFGFLIQSFDIFLIKLISSKKTVVLLSIYLYSLFHFKSYSVTSYFGIMFDTNIVIPVLFFLMLNYILNKRGEKF